MSSTPKAAYRAAKALTTQLNGYTFAKRVPLDSKEDFLLLFTKGGDVRGVAWTRSQEPHAVALPAGVGRFAVTDFLGNPCRPRRRRKAA